MPVPFDAPMPEAVDLSGGWAIWLAALDPNTGNVVPGITVADLVMMVDTVGDTVPTDLGFGSYLLVPGPGA